MTADASGLTKVEDKAPAGQVEAGRKVFVVMQNDGSDAAAVVIGAEDVKPPRNPRYEYRRRKSALSVP